MIEGERSKTSEIGESERNNFAKKIEALVSSPQFPQTPDGKVDTSVWASLYTKEEESIFVMRPIPGHPANPNDEFRAEVTNPLFDTDEGHTVIEYKALVFKPNQVFIRSWYPNFLYFEHNDVYDKKGNILPPKPPIEDPVKAYQERVNAMYAAHKLGEHIVTPERYNDIMGTLENLTREDEFKA